LEVRGAIAVAMQASANAEGTPARARQQQIMKKCDHGAAGIIVSNS